VSIAALAALAGCAETSSAAEPASVAPAAVSSARVSAPAVPKGPTQALRWYGFTNGPAGFVVPQGLTVVYRIDQPNVVTAFFAASEGPQLAAWLAAQLPGMGYRVQGSSADSVVFAGPAWSGAFTSDSKISALTLRRN